MTGRQAARAEIRVTGTVQGVGFRPFVYRIATAFDLAGTVKNRGAAGVDIVVEGRPGDLDAFVDALRSKSPPLARVDDIELNDVPPAGLETFDIVASTDGEGGSGVIPPDTGLCDDCRAEVFDPDSRYHRYWATSCVNCGPRFTVIRSLPYDRPSTTMAAFPMCEACREEYEDPADRRYHAQTIACPDCGPTLTLVDPQGDCLAERQAAIDGAARRLTGGDVVAIKGIGGAHLACDATDATAVSRLRERTRRPAKPFAVMAPSLESIRGFARVAEPEQAALIDVRRPIVLLEWADDPGWAEAVAPGLHTVGVMLPYAGLHHLLFDEVDRPLVMTSSNLPGRPMCTTKTSLVGRLSEAIDTALVHDRTIAARCDDSVVRYVGGRRRFLRRSRGWVPTPLPLPSAVPAGSPTVLALGASYDTTAAVTQSGQVVPSQYIGDVDDPATEGFLRDAVDRLLDLTGAEPAVVACDRHPTFRTTEVAEELAADGLRGPVRVQHHHAHAAALLAEHDRRRAVVITADGTGYGPDGTVWGGEVLDARANTFDRVGGLDTFALPGGQAAVERPARTLASLLAGPDRIDELLVARDAATTRAAATVIREQLAAGVNAPETTSAGRWLDAISALLDAGTERRYQGEPAMRLEALAAGHDPVDCQVPFTTRDGQRVLDVRELAETLDQLSRTHARGPVAATAQWALATGLADIAIEAARNRDIGQVGFTGGVAYNEAISARVRNRVRSAGLECLAPTDLPAGDGGIAYGQAVVAGAVVSGAGDLEANVKGLNPI